jgi:hypothetical protein
MNGGKAEKWVKKCFLNAGLPHNWLNFAGRKAIMSENFYHD